MKLWIRADPVRLMDENPGLRARSDAALRLTNLPRAVKRTDRAARGLTSLRIFTENARGRAEGREAAKARARHLYIDTEHALL